MSVGFQPTDERARRTNYIPKNNESVGQIVWPADRGSWMDTIVSVSGRTSTLFRRP